MSDTDTDGSIPAGAHDLGCQCYPHYAIQAIEAAVTAERERIRQLAIFGGAMYVTYADLDYTAVGKVPVRHMFADLLAAVPDGVGGPPHGDSLR